MSLQYLYHEPEDVRLSVQNWLNCEGLLLLNYWWWYLLPSHFDREKWEPLRQTLSIFGFQYILRTLDSWRELVSPLIHCMNVVKAHCSFFSVFFGITPFDFSVNSSSLVNSYCKPRTCALQPFIQWFKVVIRIIPVVHSKVKASFDSLFCQRRWWKLDLFQQTRWITTSLHSAANHRY